MNLDSTTCLDAGDLPAEVLADAAAKRRMEITTSETTVQLNWQGEFREGRRVTHRGRGAS